jgi:hypothetical protein
MYIVMYRPTARQRLQHTRGQQYWSSVFFVSATDRCYAKRAQLWRARWRHITKVGSDHVTCVFCDACPCLTYTAGVCLELYEIS